jgi:iron complex transport system ATP-binding protein
MPEPVWLIAQGVGLSLGDFRLEGIRLEVGPGDHLGLLGPNGSGKTTLIGLLAGERAQHEGTVVLGDEEVQRIHPGRLATLRAVLGDAADRRLPFSVRSVVEMGRYPHRHDPTVTPDADRRSVESAMERADVSHLADRIHGTLSTGERARVAFARVLAQDAPVLLLDEPAASLDIGHSELILREATLAAEAGRTVVSVIHDLNAAAHHCTTLCLLEQGRIVAMGSPWEVLTEELLSRVYDTRLRVVPHPYRDCPLVVVEGVSRSGRKPPPDGEPSAQDR